MNKNLKELIEGMAVVLVSILLAWLLIQAVFGPAP